MAETADITELLDAARDGDRGALDRVLATLYQELHAMVAFLPVWQIVLISLSSSAQASRYWLPSNSSPRKSVRNP